MAFSNINKHGRIWKVVGWRGSWLCNQLNPTFWMWVCASIAKLRCGDSRPPAGWMPEPVGTTYLEGMLALSKAGTRYKHILIWWLLPVSQKRVPIVNSTWMIHIVSSILFQLKKSRIAHQIQTFSLIHCCFVSSASAWTIMHHMWFVDSIANIIFIYVSNSDIFSQAECCGICFIWFKPSTNCSILCPIFLSNVLSHSK